MNQKAAKEATSRIATGMTIAGISVLRLLLPEDLLAALDVVAGSAEEVEACSFELDDSDARIADSDAESVT